LTRVVVLMGGRSSEHQVSLDSAESVTAALRARDHEVTTIEIGRDETWLPDGATVELLRNTEVVFPVLHGPFGEDGSVQGLLELAGVAYVGAGVAASSLAMDKDLFK
jgi:D-alanine-D-alanine ligase